MAKSLIRTVDGIGIWVRDDASFAEDKNITVGIIIAAIGFVMLFSSVYSYHVLYIISNEFFICLFCLSLIIMCMSLNWLLGYNIVTCYEVYPGSESGILIPKTPDSKADQLAICKAAQEIEFRCHEIAAKRRELDRIAGNCK